ncbi:MAG TPA: phage holin family protein [Gammaproteobacteria bacterium]|nr:phage holin family protein [Gammaproteobacteria bacterium]
MARPADEIDYENLAENVEDLERREPPPGARGDARTFTLIRRLADEVTTLFTKELALLKVEMTSALSDTRAGVVALAAGGAVVFAGLLYLLAAAMLALMLVLPGWASALIVGGVVTLIGLIMLASGRSKLEPAAFNPTRTRASMQKDRNMLERNIHEQH